MSRGYFGHSNGVGALGLGVLYREGHCRVMFLRMGGSLTRRRVYGGEILAQIVPEVGDRVLAIADKLALGLCAVVLFPLDVG